MLSSRRKVFQTREERLVLLRAAYYGVLQRDARFVQELESLAAGSRRARGRAAARSALRAFALRWNLPTQHAAADLEEALKLTWKIPEQPQLGKVDLVRPFALSRLLKGSTRVPTVRLRETFTFLYNPVVVNRSHALRDLKAELS